jgi:hypothetical protein
MKALIKFLISFPWLFSFFSCGTIQEDIYFKDVEVHAPIIQAPVGFINNSNREFQITPKLQINRNSNIFSTVTAFPPDSSSSNHFKLNNKNLEWKAGGNVIGLDLEIPVSNISAFLAGASYFTGDTPLAGLMLGYSAGKGIGNIGFRFDFGGSWQEHYYKANSIIIRSYSYAENDTLFSTDSEITSNLSYYISFSLNTYDLLINPFIQGSYIRQKYLSVSPQNIAFSVYNFKDYRKDETATFLSLTPGFYIDLNQFSRFIFSLRIIFPDQMRSSMILTPTVYMNFHI